MVYANFLLRLWLLGLLGQLCFALLCFLCFYGSPYSCLALFLAGYVLHQGRCGLRGLLICFVLLCLVLPSSALPLVVRHYLRLFQARGRDCGPLIRFGLVDLLDLLDLLHLLDLLGPIYSIDLSICSSTQATPRLYLPFRLSHLHQTIGSSAAIGADNCE